MISSAHEWADYPIKSISYFYNFFSERLGKNFLAVEKFGSSGGTGRAAYCGISHDGF
jgi:hypothetical protein